MTSETSEDEFNNRLANMDKSQLASEAYIWRKKFYLIKKDLEELISQRQRARDEILSDIRDRVDFDKMQESLESKNSTIMNLSMFIGFLLIFIFMIIASPVVGRG